MLDGEMCFRKNNSNGEWGHGVTTKQKIGSHLKDVGQRSPH